MSRSLSGLGRTSAALGLAFVASSLLFGYGWWLNHQSLVVAPVFVPLFMIGFAAVAAASGLLSGRLLDMPLTWLAMVLAYAIVYQVHFALYPEWPESEDGFYGAVALVAILYALPLTVIGYGLAALVARLRRRRGPATPSGG